MNDTTLLTFNDRHTGSQGSSHGQLNKTARSVKIS